ncbi:hypothetical protein [Streptomyces sp. NPDC059631]|uniref:hypothetical protein n=1 Tax=unclassified Streptomyces TaxID=2593676 RepID=UPI0036C14DF7
MSNFGVERDEHYTWSHPTMTRWRRDHRPALTHSTINPPTRARPAKIQVNLIEVKGEINAT